MYVIIHFIIKYTNIVDGENIFMQDLCMKICFYYINDCIFVSNKMQWSVGKLKHVTF